MGQRRGPFRFGQTIARRSCRRLRARFAARFAARRACPGRRSGAAQSPLRLRSAGFPGVDSPIVNAADSAVPTARGGLGSHTPRIDDARGACARRAFFFNDLGGPGAPFEAGFLFDGVASLENRAGSLENRDQAAGIAGVFPRRFSGEPSSDRGGSPEKRRIRPEILRRTVPEAPKFSREPSRFSPLPPPYRTLSSPAGHRSAIPRPKRRMFVCR